jgi:ubiquinone/menaquinone biosynthesis C-methylase UbiE
LKSMKNEKIINIVRQFCPPILISGLNVFKALSIRELKRRYRAIRATDSSKQDLDVYWDLEMAQHLESWGEGTVWNEIKLLLVNCKGRVLDIACGTGKTIEIVSQFPSLEVYGCDISDFLIQKAVERGIPAERLAICDATKTEYEIHHFDYGYSIGSLEHFTTEGIDRFLLECHRIVKESTFHMIPVSKSGKDEGWKKTYQSFHNNSVEWWLKKYKSVYKSVYVLDSAWQDGMSVGKWFVCSKQ